MGKKEPHRGEKGKDGGRGNNVQGRSSLRAEPEFNHETSQTARAGGDISQCLLTGFQNYSGQETAVCLPFFFFPNVSIYCGCPLSIGFQRREISCPFDHGLLYTLSCYTRSHHIWTWWRELHITQRSRENDCIFFLSERNERFFKI